MATTTEAVSPQGVAAGFQTSFFFVMTSEDREQRWCEATREGLGVYDEGVVKRSVGMVCIAKSVPNRERGHQVIRD